jgi:hypothetical protein
MHRLIPPHFRTALPTLNHSIHLLSGNCIQISTAGGGRAGEREQNRGKGTGGLAGGGGTKSIVHTVHLGAIQLFHIRIQPMMR